MARIDIHLSDLAIVLYGLAQARKHRDVGFEDSTRTYAEVVRELERRVKVDTDTLQSALWALTLLKERGLFKHPGGLTYSQFLDKLLKRTGYKFREDFNLLEVKND